MGDASSNQPSGAAGTKHRPASWPETLVYRGWSMLAVRGALLLLALVVVFGLGRLSAPPVSEPRGAEDVSAASAAPAAATVWTCSMHPQLRLPKAGPCPICFMDLIPVHAGDEADRSAPRLFLSERAQMLAKVATAPIERREVTHAVRMVGKVASDETRITYISSYIPGRLDRVYVDYTGILVRRGDHLAEIYSPDLLVAQREYLLAMESLARTQPSDTALTVARAAVGAARRKLELWGVPRDEIERLERDHQASDHMRIDAPSEGWVLDRQGYPGMYVETGTRLFTVADLSRVWVLLDAYEMDVALLRFGQTVEFESDSLPGRRFEGPIAYLDPVLNETTRTVKVRVNVANPDLELKPGMFVRAKVKVQVGEGGRVISSALAGKWICPMHPEVVKSEPEVCDECGMDLVTSESLGYAARGAAPTRVLVVPESAVLLTGRRAVVYVEAAQNDRTVYDGRVVALGPRVGDLYVVLSGLEEGERVVTRGALQIDSALQIQARPSLMQPKDPSVWAEHVEGEASAPNGAVAPSRTLPGAEYHIQARAVIKAYLELTAALAGDDVAESHRAAAALQRTASGAPSGNLTGEDAALFHQLMGEVGGQAASVADASVEEVRAALPKITAALEQYLRTFGHNRETPLYRLFCPMAFNNKGAFWLSPGPEVLNPYFGRSMLRCGEVKGRIGSDGKESR